VHLNSEFGLRITSACVDTRRAVSLNCDVQDESCAPAGCGLCTCSFRQEEKDDDGRWWRTDTTLTLVVDGKAMTFDYCVQGDVLSLRSTRGVVYTMQRFFGHGSPTVCAGRNSAQCAVGDGCSSGACVGSNDCQKAAWKDSCLTRVGCSWDESICRGTPKPCAVEDFGVRPGCELVPGAVQCTGTPLPCDGQDLETCEQIRGCTAKEQCVGGERNCSGFDHACSICAGWPGCDGCDSKGKCLGTTSCGSLDKQNCARFGCDWVQCTGTPLACEDLLPEQCDGVPGCRLVLP
jgi:hypothetical protein